MRVLVAPSELKGTLTSTQAATALAEGVRSVAPSVGLDLAPLADGGPGTVEAFLTATGARPVERTVQGPLGALVRARWALGSEGRAAVEMAAAAGLSLLRPEERLPLRASTEGVGELLEAALEASASSVVLGAGGSATTDGGTGMLRALGVRFLDARGHELPPGGAALTDLHRLDVSALRWPDRGVRLTVATDVTNPLLGPTGAAAVFAPQKGAGPGDVAKLEAGLAQLVRVCRDQLGIDAAELRGSGAAGGLTYGARVFLGAQVESGFDVVARWLSLESRVAGADWVLTGEGRLDGQSAAGKGPYRLALLCRARGVKVAAFVGRLGADVQRPALPFDEVNVSPGSPEGQLPSTEEAAAHLRTLAAEWAARHLR